MAPLVSVVIPVYNSYKYFEKTLLSVLSQSYNNLEVILVNDGCTDSTPSIIERYAQSDERIKVINKLNQGTQFARRDGVRIATGKYIQNMDCDDILLPDAILKRVEIAEKTDADIIVSPFYFQPEQGDMFHSNTLPFNEMSGIEYFKNICYRDAYWASWIYLHKRSLYLDNEIACDPDIMMTEDTILTTQLMCYSKKVVWSSSPVIKFNVHSDSLSNNKIISDKKFNDLRKYPLWIEDFLDRNGLSDYLSQEIAFVKIRVAFESFSKNRFDNAIKDMKMIRRILIAYPALRTKLHRREKKIISLFGVSSALGMLNLYRYKMQGKL